MLGSRLFLMNDDFGKAHCRNFEILDCGAYRVGGEMLPEILILPAVSAAPRWHA
jgi:hypothetical protein